MGYRVVVYVYACVRVYVEREREGGREGKETKVWLMATVVSGCRCSDGYCGGGNSVGNGHGVGGGCGDSSGGPMYGRAAAA